VPAVADAPFRISASKLKRFLQCPRSYFLKYVQRVDESVNGKYLDVGNAFDLAVQYHCSRGAVGVQSIDPKIVRMLAAAAPYLPPPGTVEVQLEYSVPHPDGFVVQGKPDLRRPLEVGDTKTTADRGRGQGRDRESPPIALDAESLGQNEQGLLYAWCEFQLAPDAPGPCRLRWVYTTKQTKPTSWVVIRDVTRAEVEAWFEAVVRPAARAMAQLHAEYDADRVLANLDACDEPRCWVRGACSPFDGPNSYDGLDSGVSLVQLKGRRPVSPAQKEGSSLAFDLKQLEENEVDLVPALEASLAKTAVSKHMSTAELMYYREDHGLPPATPEPAAAPIAINPPPVRARKTRTPTETPAQTSLEDLASELQTVVDTCQTAIARVDRLLAALRGKGAA
jgi:hypothetical protein